MAKIKAPLSELQNEVWAFVLAYFNDHDYSPTRQEIADGLKLGHRNYATWSVRAMVKKGWFELDSDQRNRNIIDPAITHLKSR